MKILTFSFLFFLASIQVYGQSGDRSVPDSLLQGELNEARYKLLLKLAKRARPSSTRYLPGKRLVDFAVKNSYKNSEIATGYRLMSQSKRHTDTDSFLYFNQLASSYFDTATSKKSVWPILAYERAEYFFKTKQLDSMMHYVDKVLGYEGSTNQMVITSAAMQLRSDYYKSINQYDSAQITLIRALNIISEGNEQHPVYNKVRAAIHIKLGALYKKSSNFTDHRRKLEKSLSLVKDSTSKVIILANLAESYLNGAQYGSAHIYAKKASNHVHDLESKIIAFRKLAETNGALNRFDEALRMRDSLSKYRALGSDYINQGLRLNHEGAILIGSGQVAEGEMRFRKIFPTRQTYASDWSPKEYVMYIKAMLPHQAIKISAKQMDTLKLLMFSRSEDSTATIIEDIRVKYETEKKEQENLLLTQQRDFEARRNQTLRNVSIGSLLFMALLAALAWLLYGRNKQLSAAKQNISRLNQEINHRATNNLRNVKLLLKDQRARAVTAGLDDSAVNELERKILAYTKLQEKLNTNLNQINLAHYLNDFCEHLREAFSSAGKPVHFNHNIANLEVSPDFAAPLALIINELATNSLKYAKREDGILSISLDAVIDDNGELRVYYRDGGPADGPIDPETSSSGQGIELVKDFTEQLEGHIIHYGKKDDFSYKAIFDIAA